MAFSLKTLFVTSTICLVVGAVGAVIVYSMVMSSSAHGEVISSNTIRIIDRVTTNLRTVYVPEAWDSMKYTNLYRDCTDLADQVVGLTNKIMYLAGLENRLRPMIGASYINRPGIPLGITGGAEWGNIVLTGTMGFQSNLIPDLAAINLMWRF